MNYLFAESHVISWCNDATCGIFLEMTFALLVLKVTILVKVICFTLGERRGT